MKIGPDGRFIIGEDDEAFDWHYEYNKLAEEEAERSAAWKESMKDLSPHRLSLILEVLEDAYRRPEVMEAARSAPLNGQIPPQSSAITMGYQWYAQRKWPHAFNRQTSCGLELRRLAHGYWTGPDDPQLIDELLTRNYYDDRKGAQS